MVDKRRTFSAEQKVSILRRHLIDGIPVSDLCDQYGLNPAAMNRRFPRVWGDGVPIRTCLTLSP